MIIKKLNDNWKMRSMSSKEYMKAYVPGSVYSDLLKNHKMEDPYYRDNEMKALKLMDEDYEYIKSFDVSKDILTCEEIMLHFDGLDTLADIYLNSYHIAFVNNMHRTFEFEVKKYLKENANELKINFHSPTKFIKEADKNKHIGGSEEAMKGFGQLRKAHCMFGWDWGPRLPDMGIWREVSLLGINKARISSVYISQEHKTGEVALNFEVGIKKTFSKRDIKFNDNETVSSGLSYEVIVISPSEKTRIYKNSPARITINNPKLWWPNGYGEQPLYGIKVVLKEELQELDVFQKRIGLRTIETIIEKDEYGESFVHEVNNVKIFAMGAIISQKIIYSKIQ